MNDEKKLSQTEESPAEGLQAQTSNLLSDADKELIRRISEAGSFNVAGLANSLRATPAARRLAQENGIDIETVEGSGPNGRVQAEDVLALVSKTEDEAVQADITTETEEVETLSDVASEEHDGDKRKEAEQELMAKVAEELRQQEGINETVPADQMENLVKTAIQEVVAEAGSDTRRPFEAMDMPNPGMDSVLDKSLEELVAEAGGDIGAMEMTPSAESEELNKVPEIDTVETEIVEDSVEDNAETVIEKIDKSENEKDIDSTATITGEVDKQNDEESTTVIGDSDVTTTEEEKSVWATPLAQKIAKDEEIDLASVQGSGQGGKILREDVLRTAYDMKNKGCPDRQVMSMLVEVDLTAIQELRNHLSEEGCLCGNIDFLMAATAQSKNSIQAIKDQSIAMIEPHNGKIMTTILDVTPDDHFADILKKHHEAVFEQAQTASVMLADYSTYGILDCSDTLPDGCIALLSMGAVSEQVRLNKGVPMTYPVMRIRLNYAADQISRQEGAEWLKAIRMLMENPSPLMV